MTLRRTSPYDDRGIVLMVVMTAIVLLSVLGVAAFTVSMQSITDSTRARSQTTAFQAASSGLERAISIPGTPTPSVMVTGSIGGGLYSVAVAQIATGTFVNRYLYTSIGTAGGATSTVTQYLDHTWVDAWSVQIAGKQATVGSAAQFNGSAQLLGSFYIIGDVELNSNPIVGGGSWYVTGAIANFKSVSWTGTGQTLYTNPDCVVTGWVGGWGGTGRLASPVPSIELPFVDQALIKGSYALARVESSDNKIGCTGNAGAEVSAQGDPGTYTGLPRFPTAPVSPSLSSCYKVVQATNTAVAPTIWNGVSARTAYTIGPSPFGRTTDDFALVGGVLYVRGTVFIDGNLTITDAVTSYRGFGTLVVNGNVTLGSPPNSVALQPADATNVLVPRNLTSTANLGIVAVGKIVTERIRFEGTLFSNGAVEIGKKAAVWGSVHGATIKGDTQSDMIVERPVEFELVPPSMPGSTTDTRVEKRTYRKLVGPWMRK